MDGNESRGINLVGYEWEYAMAQAGEAGVRLKQVLTSPPRGSGSGTLRVIRQQMHDGMIVCTCAAEEWGDSR